MPGPVGHDRPAPGPDVAEAAVARVDVDAALARLPEAFRVAVVLRDLGGCDYAEIAAICGVPAGTVKSRIARARAMLAAHLTPTGNPVPDLKRLRDA